MKGQNYRSIRKCTKQPALFSYNQ